MLLMIQLMFVCLLGKLTKMKVVSVILLSVLLFAHQGSSESVLDQVQNVDGEILSITQKIKTTKSSGLFPFSGLSKVFY